MVRYYGCRHCHQLTYRRCQESDKRVNALHGDPAALWAAMHSEELHTLILALKAMPDDLWRIRGNVL